jgi:hypothetical protein
MSGIPLSYRLIGASKGTGVALVVFALGVRNKAEG